MPKIEKPTEAKKPNRNKAKLAEHAKEVAPISPEALEDDSEQQDRPLQKAEFIQRLAEATNRKPGDLRDTLETTLRLMGDALTAGESLNLPPLGRMKPLRQNPKEDGEILVVRIRRKDTD